MDEHLAYLKKERIKNFLGLLVSTAIFCVCSFLFQSVGKETDLSFLLLMLCILSCLIAFPFLILSIESLDKYKFIPKYQVGETIIISTIDSIGQRDFKFSQYDEIIEGIPKYMVKEIGKCSYLLSPVSGGGNPQEVKFRRYDSLFSISEFKERANCC